MTRVLIVDDDKELCNLLTDYLAGEGIESDQEYSGGGGLAALRSKEYDLMLLDVLLPDMTGFDVMKDIRSESDVPVIMLTGCDQEADRVLGLEMGADDYVSKPLRLRELLARIRVVLRRVSVAEHLGPKRDGGERLTVGNLDIHSGSRRVRVQGRDVPLTAAEFGILEQLAQESGQVVGRETLINKALGNPDSVDDCVLNVHICNLRRKLGEDVTIKTVRGWGYLLASEEAPV